MREKTSHHSRKPFFQSYEVGEQISFFLIVRHASTILLFLSFSKQSAGGIISFCLNIDKGFLLLLLLLLLSSLFSLTISIHYHYLYLFSLCSHTEEGNTRKGFKKHHITHTHTYNVHHTQGELDIWTKRVGRRGRFWLKWDELDTGLGGSLLLLVGGQ